jgi:hypothetical protein
MSDRIGRDLLCRFGTCALLAAFVVVAPAARAQTADNPAINVQFSTSGQIAVSLVDGTRSGHRAASRP